MVNRLRRAWVASRLLVARMAAALDRDDVLLLVGLAMVGGGLWRLSPIAGLVVPGAVLLWHALPTRPPFVDRSPSRDRRS